jgi:prephenate dehydrogenase
VEKNMKIAIIGLGLIGSSWGLALKNWAKSEEGLRNSLEVIGFDSIGKRRNQAERMNVVDKIVSTPMAVVKGAQVVIICTPVMAIRETFEDIARELEPGAIVTDTASTKRDVMNWAKELLPTTVNFIGGHPMAGRTGSIEEATPELFRNAIYCLTPLPTAKEEALDTLISLIEKTGAGPRIIDAEEHDSYVAAISHLPFLTSAVLMNLVSESEGWREISRLAATGFQDTTRLAGGSVQMHLDICRTNNDAIISWLDRYQHSLSQLRQLLEAAGTHDERGKPRPEAENDSSQLEAFFEKARQSREEWVVMKRTKPIETPFEDKAMPSRSEMKMDVGRMFTGNIFKRRLPDIKDDKDSTKQ